MVDQIVFGLGLAILSSALVYAILRWTNLKAGIPRVVQMCLSIPPRLANRIFVILTLGYTIFFSFLAISHHLALNKNSLDLAIYVQVLWNSLNGRLFENTLGPDSPNLLGQTFAPARLAFVPLYALWTDPIILIIFEVVVFGVGAIPIYWFARERLGHTLALVVAIAYFLTPTVEAMLLAEFYEIWLVIPLLGFVMYFLMRRHYKGTLACLAVALLVKEEVAFIAIGLGLFVFIVQRQRKFGLGILLTSLVWIVLVMQYLVPFFRAAQSFYYFDEHSPGGSRYGYLGHNLPEILRTILTRPDIILNTLWVPEKIGYVLHHLLPLAFLPLVGIEVAMLALPTFGYTLLSQAGFQYQVFNQYRAPLLPFLFFATIVGAERLLKWRAGKSANDQPARVGALALLLLVASSAYNLQTSYLFHLPAAVPMIMPNEHSMIGHTLARTIPSEATVIAQNEFLAILAHRQAV